MATETSTPHIVPGRWKQANDRPVAIGLWGPATVLLVLVAMLELFGLALVLKTHVAQAKVREHIRVSTPFQAHRCAAPNQALTVDCATQLSLVSSP